METDIICEECDEPGNHNCLFCNGVCKTNCQCEDNQKILPWLKENGLNPDCWIIDRGIGLLSVSGEIYIKYLIPSKLSFSEEDKDKVVTWMKLCEELGIV